MTPRAVAQDLEKCHQLTVAPSYVLATAPAVGPITVDKKAAWELRATGMDGATMPLVDENFKVAMVGTLSTYDSRFCRSGMKWKRESGDQVLQLRAIRLSRQ